MVSSIPRVRSDAAGSISITARLIKGIVDAAGSRDRITSDTSAPGSTCCRVDTNSTGCRVSRRVPYLVSPTTPTI